MESIFRHKKMIFLVFLFGVANCFSQQSMEADGMSDPVRFKQDGKFKIAQFTDIHVHFDTLGEPEKTRENLEFILKTEKPDLSVLTGDIVNSPAPKGWQFIADIFSSSGIPWTVVYGNHDDEDVWSREDIYNFLRQQKGYIGNAVSGLSGVSNFIIPVISATTDTTAAVLYFFDSHGYPEKKKHGHYDWIKPDQIQWYRDQSDRLTSNHHNKPFPALAFMHIPLPEYKQIIGNPTYIGIKEEDVCSPDLNSGLFTSFVEKQDVMGVFCGHDHDNNYIGILNDVALAFGQVSGHGGYGKFNRGSRIIELSEGFYNFRTWIRTEEKVQFEYEYPSGLSFSTADFQPVSAVEQPGKLKQGVSFGYFKGNFKSAVELNALKPVRSGDLRNFSLETAEDSDQFGFEFEGFIHIPTTGNYRFYTISDDGSMFYIGDSLVVNNDGSHSLERKEGSIALEKGFHPYKLLYFQDYMGKKLEVGISGISIKETRIPDEMLFITKD